VEPGSWATEWTTWMFAGTVVLAYAAAVWTAMRRPQPRAELPMAHVAAAALIGLVAWNGLTDVRRTAAVTGLPVDVLTGIGLFVIGVVIAIVGILRRRWWGIALGIGLAAAHALGSVVALFEGAALEAGAVVLPNGTGYFEYIAPTIVMNAVPSLVAIGLLAWPLGRRRPEAGHEGEGDDRAESTSWQPSPTEPPSR
jgi:hypothetical protein